MTVNQYVYAIKIEDIAKLAVIGNIYQDKKTKKKFDNSFYENYNDIAASASPADLQNDLAKAFLKLIKKTIWVCLCIEAIKMI